MAKESVTILRNYGLDFHYIYPLMRAGVRTINDFAGKGDEELLSARGMGKKRLERIRKALDEYMKDSPLEIELSTLLNSGSNDDKKILNTLKRQGVTTLGSLQSLLAESRYISPKERIAYQVSGLGKTYFRRLEEVTEPLGVDIYAGKDLDPVLKPFMEIAKGYVPHESYYDFRREVEEAYAQEKAEEE